MKKERRRVPATSALPGITEADTAGRMGRWLEEGAQVLSSNREAIIQVLTNNPILSSNLSNPYHFHQ